MASILSSIFIEFIKAITQNIVTGIFIQFELKAVIPFPVPIIKIPIKI